MKKAKVIDIYEREWKTEDIHYWTNPKDGVVNASVLFDGKSSRLRAGLIIIKDGNQILLGHEKDEPEVFSLPGGSINKGESFVDAAIREAQEEVGITAKNVEEAGIDYCEVHDEVKDWVRDNVPDEEWWYNYYTVLCIGEYDKEYKGKVDKEDKDPSMKKSAEFYLIDEVIDDPSFKQAWKETLINYGYYEKPINESYTDKSFKTGTAGFILEDGTFLYADMYNDYIHGGFSKELLDKFYPEFSNTHAEEDTCVRLYKEPNEIQYKKLEEIIDTYLDLESYCKIEVWGTSPDDRNPHLYEVCSLFEGACEDYREEEIVDNWTGYKLIQKIKNFFRSNSVTEEITRKPILTLLSESSRTSLLSKSKGADKYANGKGSRWTQKSKCAVASTVKDYNKIDMNTFWKDDKLTFGVRVTGETNSYVVTISFDHILDKIQRKIHDNKNLLEFKCIYDALIQAINSGDIKVSCTCPDYKYRIKYWNSQNGDEAGAAETRKSDITNPEDSKGPACKHILAVLNNVEWLNKVASVINNYANYCKDNMEYNYSKYIFPKLYGMDYKKAVQMTLDDYDDEGNVKDNLESDEELINLSNALGKVRGRIKKGSNKNPAAKKKEESLEESLNLNEDITQEPFLSQHFDDHCLASDNFGKKHDENHYDKNPFTKDEVPDKEAYKDFALWFVTQLTDESPNPSVKNKINFLGRIQRLQQASKTSKHDDLLIYCKTDQQGERNGTQYPLYLYATYYDIWDAQNLRHKPIIRTFYKIDEWQLDRTLSHYKKLTQEKNRIKAKK